MAGLDEAILLDLATCNALKGTIEIVIETFNAENAIVLTALNHLLAELCLEFAHGDHEAAKSHADAFHIELLRIMREELH